MTKKKKERKNKKLMFPRSLFTVSRTKNIFFHSVFALCGQSGIESMDFTFFLKHSIFFPSCLFSLVFYYLNMFDNEHLYCNNASQQECEQNLVSSKKATYGGISNILFYGSQLIQRLISLS